MRAVSRSRYRGSIQCTTAEHEIAAWAIDAMVDAEMSSVLPMLTEGRLHLGDRISTHDLLYRIAVQLPEMDAPAADVRAGRTLAYKIRAATGIEEGYYTELRDILAGHYADRMRKS